MLAPSNKQLEKSIEKYMKAFLTLSLPQDRLNAIEDYLRGNIDVEVIDRYPKIDLTQTDCEKFEKLISDDLHAKKRLQFGARVFHVYYSLGKENTHMWCTPYELMCLPDENEYDRIKILVSFLFYRDIHRDRYRLNYVIEYIRKMTKDDSEILLDMIQKQKGMTDCLKLISMGSYFIMKYEKQYLEILQTGKKHEIHLEEDSPVFCCLEQIVLKLLKQHSAAPDSFLSSEGLEEILCLEKFDESILRLIKNCDWIQQDFTSALIGIAYRNCLLSNRFLNIVRIFAVLDSEIALSAIADSELWYQNNENQIADRLKIYDRVFYIDPSTLIYQSYGRFSKTGYEIVWREQLKRNEADYLTGLSWAGYRIHMKMLDFLKRENENLYQQYTAENPSLEDVKKEEDYKNIHRIFEISLHPMIEGYLEGKKEISDFYVLADGSEKVEDHNFLWGCLGETHTVAEEVNEEWLAKLICLSAIFSPYTLYFLFWGLAQRDAASFWDAWEKEGLAWEYRINCAITGYVSKDGIDKKEEWNHIAFEHLRELHSMDEQKLLDTFHAGTPEARYMALHFYQSFQTDYRKEILSFSKDTSKMVKDELQKIVLRHPEWEKEVIQLLASKKTIERELAVYAISAWTDENHTYREVLSAAIAKEKNKKLLERMQEILKVDLGGEKKSTSDMTKKREELALDMYKKGRRKQLTWIYENTSFAPVHKKDGRVASEEYLQAICLFYISMEKCGVNEQAKFLAEDLDEAELAEYANLIFERWVADGALAKKKWVLYYAAIHGGSAIAEKMRRCILDWSQISRGAIAADAVAALALNHSPQALYVVDSIARKFKVRQVREAARKALNDVTKEMGITREELSDRIVPDYGFDENMERRFDYGARSFLITITPAMEIEVRDEKRKKLKTMPAPGKRDEEEKAKAAYEEFKELKKQLKETVSGQIVRMEETFSSARLWNAEDWKKLFVKNPIMHPFALSLIWGVYEEGSLKETFRYMEDGTFNTEDEEEFDFPESGKIGLVHPLELTEESIAAWKEQLSDYEIRQPFEQLERPFYRIAEEEKDAIELKRFAGMIVNDRALKGKLLGMAWNRGGIGEEGEFDAYYRENEFLGLGVDLYFSGSYVNGGDTEDITVYKTRFYKIGTIFRESYSFSKVKDSEALPLGELPARYFSETVLQLTRATASSTERDENWEVEN